jgi:hypothetical protein
LVWKLGTVGKRGKPGLLALPALPCLQRLAEPVTLAIHLENVAAVAMLILTDALEETRHIGPDAPAADAAESSDSPVAP